MKVEKCKLIFLKVLFYYKHKLYIYLHNYIHTTIKLKNVLYKLKSNKTSLRKTFVKTNFHFYYVVLGL